MESALDITEVEQHMDKMCQLPWKEQIVYIINNALMNDDHVLGEYLITKYSIINSRSFNMDHNRYLHDYLRNVNMHQVIHIYDNLQNKEDFIVAIKIDHPHLKQMIDIHNQLVGNSIEPDSPMIH